MKTVRSINDFYPTPEPVVRVCALDMRARGADLGRVFDPAAGEGDLLLALAQHGLSEGYGYELDPARAQTARAAGLIVCTGDALPAEWPELALLANPPFCLLDEFWTKISAHRAAYGVWCACLTPVAWWHAVSRAQYTRPDHFLALGWRPAFRKRMGSGHKGNQDFVWAILYPEPGAHTTWSRVEEPK